MAKAPEKPKKVTRSRRSRSTRRSSASTLTSRPSSKPASSRKDLHRKLANELYSRSLRPRAAAVLQDAVVEGVSMWPTLRPGYRIRYRAVDPETLSPGDILVLRSRGRKGEAHVRVHRLLGRVGPYFVEAGDNAYSAALLSAADILGRVVDVRDWNGKAVKVAEISPRLDRRFRFLLGCAHAFMFAHECKDRLVGQRRSLTLWRLSQLYRAGLGAAGLSVPAIPPGVS